MSETNYPLEHQKRVIGIRPKWVQNHWFYFFLYGMITLFFLQDWIFEFSHSILGSDQDDGSLTIWIAYWPYLKSKSLFLGLTSEPYLNSNIFYGFEGAYSYSDMMPSLLPFVFILDSLFHSPILTINFLQLTLIFLLPCGTYLLYLELGFDESLSFLSGMICSFTGFHVQQYLHFQLQLIGLFPFGIVFLIRYFKKPNVRYLLYIAGILIFLAGSSTHIFLYFVLALFLLLIVYFLFLVSTAHPNLKEPTSFRTTLNRLRNEPSFSNTILPILSPIGMLVVFSTITIGVLLIYPYYYNATFFHFKRLKVDTLLFSFSPLDYKRFGFDFLHLLFLFFIFLIPFQWRTLSFAEKFKMKMILFIITLIYLFSLGARKYYPYNLLFDYFPGFSGIRDSSRIFFLFWFPFGAGVAFVLKNCTKYISPILNERLFLFAIFTIELVFMRNRSPQIQKIQIPEEVIQIHQDYSKGVYKDPLLIVSNRNFLTSYIDIDAYSQYLSVFHQKNLVGGYSGQYPYSPFMLRFAISSYLSGDSQWKKQEIETIIASSPVGSIALYDVPETWRKKLSSLNDTQKNQSNPCGKLLKGSWRNLPKISPNYGLILGYTPNQEFCINPYNKILDREVSLKWIKNEKVVYTDTLYIHSPFYHHPSAPELLYNTEGFRDRGEYTLQLFQEGEMLYTGLVLVQ